MKIKSLYFMFSLCVLPLGAQEIEYQLHPVTKAIECMDIRNDNRDMKWLLDISGKQYKWVTEKYSWGLGYFTQNQNGKMETFRWKQPSHVNGDTVVYKTGGIEILVKRTRVQQDLLETYSFKNVTASDLELSNIGIYVPLNDNYPDAATCLNGRTHAHVWAGDNAAYHKCHTYEWKGSSFGPCVA